MHAIVLSYPHWQLSPFADVLNEQRAGMICPTLKLFNSLDFLLYILPDDSESFGLNLTIITIVLVFFETAFFYIALVFLELTM